MTKAVDLATTDCVGELATVAAQTFSLACLPSVPADDVASFVATHLSAACFAEYLADPRRAVLTARRDDRIAGYAILVHGVGDDADVRRAVDVRPAAELSKIYVLPNHHGTGLAHALMDLALQTAGRWGARCVWLGVNQKNQRAQHFYFKCGFRVNGTRTFRVGACRENDYVMVRAIR